MPKNPDDTVPATVSVVCHTVSITSKCKDMCDGLEDHQSRGPAMEQVESVATNVKNLNKWVVAKRKQDGEDQVESSECTAASLKLGKLLSKRLLRNGNAVCKVAKHVDRDDEQLRPCGKRAHSEGARESYLAFMSALLRWEVIVETRRRSLRRAVTAQKTMAIVAGTKAVANKTLKKR